jgi:hypothetical protein
MSTVSGAEDLLLSFVLVCSVTINYILLLFIIGLISIARMKLKKSLGFKAQVQPYKLTPLTVLLEYIHDKKSRSKTKLKTTPTGSFAGLNPGQY